MDLGKWNAKIEDLTQRFESEFGTLSTLELNYKPGKDTWSIGEIIEHLILVNESYFPQFELILKNQYRSVFLGKFRWIANIIGNFILKSVQPTNSKKVKTMSMWEPGQSDVSDDIVQEFIGQQSRMLDFVGDLESQIKENPIISSPLNRNIVYPIQTALEIIAAHEERHFGQALLRKEELKKDDSLM